MIGNSEEAEFDTLEEMYAWRSKVLRMIDRELGKVFTEIQRDDRSGLSTTHFCSLTLPPAAAKPTIMTVHPLSCDCTDAPHVVRLPTGPASA